MQHTKKCLIFITPFLETISGAYNFCSKTKDKRGADTYANLRGSHMGMKWRWIYFISSSIRGISNTLTHHLICPWTVYIHCAHFTAKFIIIDGTGAETFRHLPVLTRIETLTSSLKVQHASH